MTMEGNYATRSTLASYPIAPRSTTSGACSRAARADRKSRAIALLNATGYARRRRDSTFTPHVLGAADSEASMTTFDKREEGFEKQFARDEELKFKAMARRNKLLGLWAAQKLGLSGAEADAYSKEVVMADFEEEGDHDVFRKVRKDFDAKGVVQSDHQIRRTMDELLAQAVTEIRAR
jgi:hypothetical protein